MPKTTLNIPVDPDVARAYEAASPEFREEIGQSLSRTIRHRLMQAGPEPSPVAAGPPPSPGERLSKLRAAAGLWKHRDDLPTRGEHVIDSEDRLKRLFGEG